MALKGREPVRFPPSLSPQLLNQRRGENQIPSCAWSSSHPARPDRLSVPSCSLRVSGTHMEHSSRGTLQVSCCSTRSFKVRCSFSAGGQIGGSSRYLLTLFPTHTLLYMLLTPKLLPHECVQMRHVSVVFIPPACPVKKCTFLSCYLLNTKAYSMSSEGLIPVEKLLQ